MFDHVKFGVSDYAASKAFFLKALEPLGVAVVAEGPPTTVSSLAHQRVRLHCALPNRGEAGASSPGVHGRESPASRSFLSRGDGGGWQRQWRAWSVPGIPRELLCSFRHWSGRAQHRSGLPRTRGLTKVFGGRSAAGSPVLLSCHVAHAKDRDAAVVRLWAIEDQIGVTAGSRILSRPTSRCGGRPSDAAQGGKQASRPFRRSATLFAASLRARNARISEI